MSDKRKRLSWKAADKLRIVLAGLDGGIEISELCRREGINPTQYCGWKKQLLSSAAKVFDNGHDAKPSAPSVKRTKPTALTKQVTKLKSKRIKRADPPVARY